MKASQLNNEMFLTVKLQGSNTTDRFEIRFGVVFVAADLKT